MVFKGNTIMPTTEKMYAIDAYIKEFNADVLKIDNGQIFLDRTAFYPESGGQVGDIGYLNNTRVVNTIYDKEKKYIIHIIEEEPDFKEGDKIVGKIDWNRRYNIMRHHSASHIVEYFLYNIFGELKLVGTSVDDRRDSSTYLSLAVLDKERLEQVEKLSNEFILKGHEIERWEDSSRLGWWYWKAGEIKLPCGGTHPRNVKEIGQISIKRKSGGKGKEKISTFCK